MKMISIQKLIDETIKSIWQNEIKNDYDSRWLLKEDTLKASFYFHLRNKLGHIFDLYNIRIFTEFTDNIFKGSGKRPDMVIAEYDRIEKHSYFGDNIKNCYAVIEFKFKSGLSSENDIDSDYDKLRFYVEKLKVDCPLYMVTLWEYPDTYSVKWVRKNAKWAKGRLTELYASWDENYKMQFHEPFVHR